MTTDTTTATMRAIVRDTYGNADVLRLATSPDPRPPTTKSSSASMRPVLTGAPGT